MESGGFGREGTRRGLLFFAAGVLCLLLAGGLVFFFSGRFTDRPSGNSAGPALSLSSSPLPRTAAGEKTDSGEGKKPWVLYITGEVSSPGVYTLSSDVRVFDLVDAAGGLTPKADPVRINLAAPLSDGMHIHVPGSVLPGKDGSSFLLPEPPAQTFSSSAAEGGPLLVNINRATQQELENLPGVGPATAKAILEYRRTRGSFSSPEDLLGVKGIGPVKLEGMRRNITLQ